MQKPVCLPFLAQRPVLETNPGLPLDALSSHVPLIDHAHSVVVYFLAYYTCWQLPVSTPSCRPSPHNMPFSAQSLTVQVHPSSPLSPCLLTDHVRFQQKCSLKPINLRTLTPPPNYPSARQTSPLFPVILLPSPYTQTVSLPVHWLTTEENITEANQLALFPLPPGQTFPPLPFPLPHLTRDPVSLSVHLLVFRLKDLT